MEQASPNCKAANPYCASPNSADPNGGNPSSNLTNRNGKIPDPSCSNPGAGNPNSNGPNPTRENHNPDSENPDEYLRSLPAPFLTKTYQLVDDSATDEVISWNGDGSTFVVWRPPKFAKDILPNYFKHNNFSSFVRQLNTYGFRKIVSDRWEFSNDFFRRGGKHLLNDIHRRKTVARWLRKTVALPSKPCMSLPKRCISIETVALPSKSCMSLSKRCISPTNSADEQATPLCPSPFSSSRERSAPPPLSDKTVALPSKPCMSLSKRCISPTNSADKQATALSSSPFSSSRERSAPSPLSDETERLRKENMLLVSELVCLRKLCSDLLLYIQKHVKGSPQDISSIARFLQCNNSGASESYSREGGNEGEENIELTLMLPEASFQETAACDQIPNASRTLDKGRRSPPKLFGVPLQCRKRMKAGGSGQQGKEEMSLSFHMVQKEQPQPTEID